MVRIPHILKAIRMTQCPSNLLFFDCETRDVYKGRKAKEEKHALWFGHAIAYRYVEGVRTRRVDRSFSTVSEFWELFHSRLDNKRPLYVYAHNVGFDCTIIDFWKYTEHRDYVINFAVLESPPVIISGTYKGQRFNVIDTVNYFKVPLKTLGASVGLEKLECDIAKATYEEARPYCIRDTEIIAKAIDSLIDFVRENRLGKLGATVASLAMSSFKHRFMSHDIFIHDRARILKLEKDSYHGGMVGCNFIGKVRNETVYKYDVNSLYPTVMLNDYPTRLSYSLANPTIEHVSSELRKYAVIAKVRISTKRMTYPLVYKGQLLFALGDYTCVLCDPELSVAIKEGNVARVYEAAFYDRSPIFHNYVTFFWNKRALYKSQGDIANATLCKYLLNSLYGKFGQGAYRWVSLHPATVKQTLLDLGEEESAETFTKGPVPTVKSGQIEWIPLNSAKAISLRRVGNKVQMKAAPGIHAESFVGIASYVTSYARQYLRDLIAVAGERNVYYYDTDSLFVNKTGRRRLQVAGKLSETSLGGLKLEGEENSPTFIAPKDYIFGKEIKRKGVRRNAKVLAPNTYEQLQFEGLRSVIKRGGEAFILIKKVRKKLLRTYKKGRVGKDGWTIPLILNLP